MTRTELKLWSKYSFGVGLYIVAVVFTLAGCATPGQMGGMNYQQVAPDQFGRVNTVTVLTLNPETERQMLHAPNVVEVGYSQFQTEGTGNFEEITAQAKAQGHQVGANVVLLSRAKAGTETKHRTVKVESDSQKAIEALPNAFSFGTGSSDSHSSTSYHGNTKETTSTSFGGGVAFAGTLADLTALIPGQVTYKDEEYCVDLYHFQAIFLRHPGFKGL